MEKKIDITKYILAASHNYQILDAYVETEELLELFEEVKRDMNDDDNNTLSKLFVETVGIPYAPYWDIDVQALKDENTKRLSYLVEGCNDVADRRVLEQYFSKIDAKKLGRVYCDVLQDGLGITRRGAENLGRDVVKDCYDRKNIMLTLLSYVVK